MRTYPGAAYKPLGPQTEPTMTAHDVVCLHTMVGYLSSTDGYFRLSNGAGYDGTESHIGIGGKWGKDGTLGLDGTVWQWQDFGRTADANGQGNYRVISIETADNAARPIQPWTPLQCEAISQLLAWLSTHEAHADCPPSWACHREGIPLVLIPDSKPGRRGIAYHRQGIDPWRVAGGEVWSSPGKDCPTDARVAQIPAVIARAIEITQGDDMTPEQDAALKRIENLLLTGRQDAGLGSPAWPYPFSAIAATLVAAQTGAAKLDAEAIAAAIPDDIARQVADELAKRLGSP